MNTIENRTFKVHDEELWRLNNEKVHHLLPVIVFVILVMIFGLIGNSIVCFVYYFKMRSTPSHYFVLFLAALDLVTCAIGMPTELVDLFMPYVFTKPFACKFLRFVLSFTVISSCITLICVAFDRYFKVCRPTKSFRIRKVQMLCVVAVVIGVSLSWPALAIYGIKKVSTSNPEIDGHECSTADNVRDTVYPLVYTVALFLSYIITFVIFASLYVRIGFEIRKRKNMSIGEIVPNSSIYRKSEVTSSMLTDDESTSAVSEDEHKPRNRRSSLSHIKDYFVQHFRPISENRASPKDGSDSPRLRNSTKKKSKKKNIYRNIRTTYIFLAVFLAFLLSFLPFLIVNILKFSKIAFYDFKSDAEEIIYNFCVRSYFISNFVNPIIYSVLNKNFRKECKKVLSKCCTKKLRNSGQLSLE